VVDLLHRRRASSEVDVWAGRAGRFGLACRGVVYLIVAILAVRLALGHSSEADQRGALEDIARHPFGQVVVLAIAVGFLGLAAWQGIWAVRSRRADPKHRLIAAGKTVVYLALAAGAAAVAVHRSHASSDQQTTDATAQVMRHPFGQLLVGAVGLAICIGGIVLFWKAVHRGYDVEVHVGAVPRRFRRPFQILGAVGMTARAVVFALIGFFLVEAAATFDPNHARGLDGALRSVVRAPFGRVLLVALALGLAAFGCFSLLEARYADT
jgi:hypothetical protein